ncbi:peptide chain release factor I [Planoprotostelium fungivorum]|uniref:Peptide chain release factor I n=1 Tax=Planoprotostelium fungivorum TaxID=1890364 RepID=A0A2P6NLV0_9EUKA|nr:peptide chain release factor I [Planoprotostelium fungivorum]
MFSRFNQTLCSFKPICIPTHRYPLFRRQFSEQSKTSERLIVPTSKVEFAFSRSSGPGGQNVNKVNSKAELRFHVDSADWISEDVKKRFKAQQAHRITNEGEFICTSIVHRTQSANVETCVRKLENLLEEARLPPNERKETAPPSYAAENRLKEKKSRSNIKQNRSRGSYFDD